MSSCDPRRIKDGSAGRKAGRVVSAALAIAMLAGCSDGSGFRPLYAVDPSGVGVQEKLAHVEVAPIPSRLGQRIRNELIFQSTGGGEAEHHYKYRLQIVIVVSVGSTLVQTTGEALSQVYNLDASFKLVRKSDMKAVLEGTSYARAGFERFQQIYSNVRAQEDAENRVARQVADDIKTRLAIFLSKNKA